jgi:beta-glucosidase/6-phospho-beta-glucosidase/beta-galactosidase
MRDGFLWGVATAAYQVEGGLNGRGEPANDWALWDRSGRVERCGEALRFWDEPDELLDRAAAMGCNAFRLSIEWARVQPWTDRRVTIEPDWDPAALDRYADILRRCRDRGMEPVVTLHHFTHPLWCGEDFWLRPDAPERFERYVRRCVAELGRRAEPVRWWITINEPVVSPLMGWILGRFPPGRRDPRRAMRVYDHIVAGHVRAYDAIHDTYASEGWAPPLVSTNTISFTAVAFDALLVDSLLARERGVGRADLRDYLRSAAARARRRVAAVRRRDLLASAIDTVADRAARLAVPGRGARMFDELYRSDRPRKLDYLSLDCYDPVIGHFAGPARHGFGRYRGQRGIAELWEQRHDADAFAVFLRQAHLQAPDRPILVAENGMCTPGAGPRPDGVRRDALLRAMCAEVVRARDEGIAVAGYLHWTLADNYEWGSYRPRFGLHGVDRSDGVRILDTDASGVDAAGAYRELIAADRLVRRPAP